jgi:hypothetical protein
LSNLENAFSDTKFFAPSVVLSAFSIACAHTKFPTRQDAGELELYLLSTNFQGARVAKASADTKDR